MRIELHNLTAKLAEATRDERRFVSSYLTFEDAKAKYRKGGRWARKGSADKIRLYNLISESFPSGFLRVVHRAARAAGHTVEVADLRPRPCAIDRNADLAWLRDYQLDAVHAVHKRSRGIIWVPTGGGKTEIAAGLVMSLPCRWLFVVHRTNLAENAAERFELRNGGTEAAGMIVEGRFDVQRYTCATFQSLWSLLKNGDQRVGALLSNVEGIIVDEAHTLPASSFWRVVMACPSAFFRVGMSGTPLARGDRRSMFTIAATGPVLYRIKPEVLIQAGVLSRPLIRMCAIEQTTKGQNYQGVYGECVVRSSRRNRLVLAMTKAATKPAIVFVKQIDHGKDLQKRFSKAGIESEFVWGEKNLAKRKAAVRRLEHGDTDVMIASVVFQEGVDIPDLRAVVNAAGGKSAIAALQRMGRGMRVSSDGSTDFEVWDVYDERPPMLMRHAKARRKAYEAEGHEVQIVEGMAPAPRSGSAEQHDLALEDGPAA